MRRVGEEGDMDGMKKSKGQWCKPARKVQETLKVFNSLTNTKDEFTPELAPTVRWYSCGPTVYDVAHLGHARAYLTFDILRRIMEDYFGYEVLLQMNVTDIDDKIILRARRAALLRERIEPEVAAGGERLAAVAKRARSLLAAKLESAEKTVVRLDEKTASASLSGMEAQQHEEAVKIAALKLEHAREALAAADAALENGKLDDAVTAGADALADALDDEFGAEVTDHAIFAEHAQRYERSFFEDLKALNVRMPTVVTRVSEYVPEIVAYIEKLIESELAYESNGSVYFDTRAFRKKGHAYPKLCPSAGCGFGGGGNDEDENGNADDENEDAGASSELLAEGEGALAASADEKQHASDFALWKRSKRGEPFWPSPWGEGRPGWHIECSVMASEVLGEHLDVHTGGSDLKFPHHDNEMAQAEAYYGCSQWVDYFMHAGHLHIRGLKMSKSLKNFITIRQALEVSSARQLRLMFLMSHWDRPIVYSDQALDDAKAKEATLRNFFGTVKALETGADEDVSVATRQSWRAEEKALHMKLDVCRATVRSALCDNFGTPRAMAALIELVGHGNAYLNEVAATKDARIPLVQEVARYVTQILRVFGVVTGTDDIGFTSTADAGGGQGREAVLAPVLREVVGFRDDVRSYAREQKASSLLELCDAFRDEACIGLGIRVEDRSSERSIFKFDDPEVLRKELEAKREREREAAAKKRANKRALIEKELRKFEAAAVPVHEYFKTASEKYGPDLDESHLPTTTADGEQLSKAARKKCESELRKHAKNREDLEKKSGGDIIGFLEDLRAQMASLSST